MQYIVLFKLPVLLQITHNQIYNLIFISYSLLKLFTGFTKAAFTN